PYFHPSGRYLIFTANKLGFSNFELFLVDAEGTREPVRITFTEGFDGLPVFSPDGQKLCWTSGRTSDGKSQLFMADWNQLAALVAAPPREANSAQAGEKTTDKPDPLRAALLREEVEYLASPRLEGRATGGTGARQAAEHLAGALREAGLVPLPSMPEMFQP